MNRLKLLAAVALLGIPLAACEETTPPPPVGSIAGTVSIEGTGIDGVSVNLSNGNTTTTAGGGSYRFDNVEGGAYTITISGFPSDATFDATSAAATIASAGQSVTVNFTGAYIRTASVMGTVTVENMGLGGVTVALSGVSSATTVTDDNGQYTFTGLRMGNYSVEISGFNNDEIGFSATSSAVTVGTGESKIVSFDGTYLRTAGIQGQVSVEGVGLEGVNVSLAGGPDGEDMSTTTDAAGLYTFAKLRAGDYAVGISGFNTDDYEFAVTSQNVTIALGETANVPFEGILRRTSGVAGRVSVNGMGIADVTVTVSADGMDDVTAMTDATGQYAVSALAAGDYTVTISGYDAVEYMFTDSQDVTLAMDQTMIVNFEGTALRTASIAVSVTADDEGVAGAGVTLTMITGATSGTVLGTQATDADGGATFGPLLAGAYRVDIAVDSDEIDFESTDATVMVATAEAASVSFAGTINRTASISGSVTVDGEGMSGVAVSLTGGEGDQSAETGDDGSYSFSGLRKGDYTVSITNPDEARYEFSSTSESVSLAVGQSQSVSFAGSMTRSSSISGSVSVEGSGLAGVTVTLSGAADGEATTDEAGGYVFTGLGAGDYTVAISGQDADAYVFETTSMDVAVGDNEAATANFSGTHARTASVSGMLFVDEGMNNDMHDEGETPLPAPGVVVVLVGPGVNEQMPTATDENGAFSFTGLRAGTYQLVVQVPPQVAMALADYAYGGPATGYEIELGVGAAHMQGIPFDITHTTVNFGVTLKSGDETGDAIPGATVTLSSDAAGENAVGSGMTDDDGIASIRFARAGTSGNTVHAMVSHDDYSGDGMTTVMWDPQMTSQDASNDGDIVNLNVDATFGGATVDRGDYGGGDALAGWAVSVMMGDSAVAGASEALDEDGMGAFTMTVDAVPATFSIALDTIQDDKLDGGENFEADAIEYMHDGLSLAGTMDAGMLEATYTTQTLKVYVHHERDQVMGYTGNVLGGDVRASGMLDVDIRYINDAGRSRSFPATAKIGKSDAKGVVTFSNVPADAKVIAVADEAADAEGVMLLEPDELAAYTDDDGVTGGMFGANGGFSHTVELCPLMGPNPSTQDHDECGSFAFVSTHSVSGLVWKRTVAKSGVDFTEKDPTFVPGISVSLAPEEGKNLAGEDQSYTSAEKDNDKTPLNETHQFAFSDIAAGVYKLSVPEGWRAKMGGKGATADVGNALNPLGADVALDVTPTTATFYGRVNGGDGFPRDSVTVTANGVSAVTDEQGRYIVEGISAQTRKIGNTTHTDKVFVTASRAGFDDADLQILAFEANSVTRNDFAIAGTAESATVSGTVTAFGSDTPVAGVEIQVDGGAPMNPNAKSVRTAPKNDIYVTGTDGTYTIRVPATAVGATTTISAHKDDFTFTPVSLELSTPKGSAVSGINFQAVANSRIRGQVENPDGDGPFPGVQVTATGDNGTDTDTTGVTGTYELSLPAGTYTMDFSKAGYTFTEPEGGWDVVLGLGQSATFARVKSNVDETIATLSDLTLSGVTLMYTDANGDDQSGFMTDVMAYTANVDNDVAQTTVGATATDANATVAIMPADANATTDGHQVDLAVGMTSITATVTSADGTTIETYTVDVTRADVEPTVTLVLTPDEIAEGDGADPSGNPESSTVTATVSPTVDAEFTVTVSIDDDTWATLSDDVELSFAAGAGASTGTVTITAVNDDSYTGDRTVTVSGASSDAAVAADPADVTLTIEEDEDGAASDEVQNLAAEAGDQQVTLTWERPLGTGSDPVTGYKWTASATGQLPIGGEVGASAREHTVTGLDNGREYSFSVVAVSAVGDGDAVSPLPTATPVPEIILTLDGTTLTEGDTESPITATVSLSNPSVVAVTVVVAEVVDGTARLAVTNGASVAIAIGQTTPAATADDITITAVDNDLDDGGAAAEVQATGGDNANSSDSDPAMDGAQAHEISIADDDEAPSAPRSLTLTAGDASITAEWVSPADDGTGTSIVITYQYRVYETADGAPAADAADQGWETATSPENITEETVEGTDALVNGTEYTVEVRAVSSVTGAGDIASDTATPSA